jgi:hypothetical protein
MAVGPTSQAAPHARLAVFFLPPPTEQDLAACICALPRDRGRQQRDGGGRHSSD